MTRKIPQAAQAPATSGDADTSVPIPHSTEDLATRFEASTIADHDGSSDNEGLASTGPEPTDVPDWKAKYEQSQADLEALRASMAESEAFQARLTEENDEIRGQITEFLEIQQEYLKASESTKGFMARAALEHASIRNQRDQALKSLAESRTCQTQTQRELDVLTTKLDAAKAELNHLRAEKSDS